MNIVVGVIRIGCVLRVLQKKGVAGKMTTLLQTVPDPP